MLARDWYYNERRQIGLDTAVASIYNLDDDSDLRARAALTMLGVQRGWRVADIGCGNGVLACEAAMMGAEVDAIDISPAIYRWRRPRRPSSPPRRPVRRCRSRYRPPASRAARRAWSAPRGRAGRCHHPGCRSRRPRYRDRSVAARYSTSRAPA